MKAQHRRGPGPALNPAPCNDNRQLVLAVVLVQIVFIAVFLFVTAVLASFLFGFALLFLGLSLGFATLFFCFPLRLVAVALPTHFLLSLLLHLPGRRSGHRSRRRSWGRNGSRWCCRRRSWLLGEC